MVEAEGGKGEEEGRRDGGEEDDAGRARAHGSEGAGPLEQQVDVDQRTKAARGETTSRRPVDFFFQATHTHTHMTVVTNIIHCAGIILLSIASTVESN